jgi:hypothetical protein
VDGVIAVVLFVAAMAVFIPAVAAVPFHGDESEWINTGRYFRFIFLDGDVTSDVWRPSWLNRDQPPLGRYVIGGIVWASGTDPAHVNRSYAWDKDRAENERSGRIPGPHLLLPVRHAMATLGALSVVLLFVAGSQLGGTLVGAVAGLFAIASPLLQTYFVQARTEALLAFFSAAALVALLACAGRYARSGRVPRFAWVVGLMLGLALATKLTAAVAVVGAGTYFGAAAIARLRTAPREAAMLVGWAVATGLLVVAVWVGVNPFLWPDPVGRTWSMLTQQQAIMEEQGTMFGNPVTAALPGRLALMVSRSFVENSTPAFDYGGKPGDPPLVRRTFLSLPTLGGVSLELVMAAVGLGVLLGRVWRTWRAGQRHGVESAFGWWLAAYFLIIGENLSLDWPRYYVPTAFFGALLIGLGTQALVSLAWERPQLADVRAATQRFRRRSTVIG